MTHMLIKPKQYSKYMLARSMSSDQWQHRLENPPVMAKDSAPLAIWGTMTDTVELDNESNQARCIGANIESIYCLQLDYDNGNMSIDRFKKEYGQYRFTLYTSFSHGYKNPGTDRFRVILPLSSPLPVHVLQCPRVKENLKWWWPDCDETCFDCGHWQLLPVVRSQDSPYIWYKSEGQRKWGLDWSEYERWHGEWRDEMLHRKELAQANQDEGKDHSGAVKYVQDVLDGTAEGSRNRTLFSKLNWLHDIGARYDEAAQLVVPEDMQREFEGMLTRIWIL